MQEVSKATFDQIERYFQHTPSLNVSSLSYYPICNVFSVMCFVLINKKLGFISGRKKVGEIE